MALKAVMTMTGRSGSSLRDAASSSMPSPFGIRRSVTSASSRSERRRSMASRPDATATVSYPRSARPSAMVRAISRLSSATRTRSRRLATSVTLGGGEEDGGACAARLDDGERQAAAVVRDDLVRDGEAQARPALSAFGREERLAGPPHVGERDPRARVLDGDLDLAFGLARSDRHVAAVL